MQSSLYENHTKGTYAIERDIMDQFLRHCWIDVFKLKIQDHKLLDCERIVPALPGLDFETH